MGLLLESARKSGVLPIPAACGRPVNLRVSQTAETSSPAPSLRPSRKYQIELRKSPSSSRPTWRWASSRFPSPSSWRAGSNDRPARSPRNWSRTDAAGGLSHLCGGRRRIYQWQAGPPGSRAWQIARDETAEEQSHLHSLVEHTSINPNKAAHIGHLRNAILGDTFVRLLRAAGQRVDVQNYIDNTGVQVADVVVGLTHFEGYDLAGVKQLLADLKLRGSALTITAGTSMRGFRSGMRPTRSRRSSARRSAWKPCMPSRPAATKSRTSPIWSRPPSCAGILRPCCAWGSNTIFCPAKARSSTSNSGTLPLPN